MPHILAIVIAVIGANILFFHQPFFGFGTVGFFFLIVLFHTIIGTSFFTRHESRRQVFAFAMSLISIFLAGLSLFRASETDIFFLSMGSLVTFLVSFYLFALSHDSFGALSEVMVIPQRLASSYLQAMVKVSSFLPSLAGKGINQIQERVVNKITRRVAITPIIRGLILTTAVVVVLVVLLSSADPVFASVVRNLFSFSFPNIVISIPERLIFSCLVAVLVAPLTYQSIKSQFKTPFAHARFSHLKTELLMLTIAVASVLGIFLIIQIRYLFFAVPDITLQSFGIPTYSEYVRKGFGELILVTLLVYSVVALSMVVLRHTKEKLLLRVNLVLLTEVIALIVSVFRRLILYQAMHGFTRVRVYGTIFLLTLLALTLILIWRHVVKTSNRHFYIYEIGVLLAGLSVLGFLNVDRMIAKVFRPTVNDEIDYVYISRLSADAADGWIDAIDDAKAVANDQKLNAQTEFTDKEARRIVYARMAMDSLAYQVDRLFFRYGSMQEKTMVTNTLPFWRGAENRTVLDVNFSELQAYQSLRTHLSLQEFYEIQAKVNRLYSILKPSQQTSGLDRSFSTPLVR